MPDSNGRVTAGVDAHTDTHTAAVLDAQGRLLGTQAFATNAAGYRALLGWLRGHGEIDRVGSRIDGVVRRCARPRLARRRPHGD